MHIETIDIIITSLASIKIYFLFVMSPKDFLKNMKIAEIAEINKVMEKFSNSPNKEEIRSMLLWIKTDGFDVDIHTNVRNSVYLYELKKLSDEFFNFFIESLSELTEKSPEYERSCDVYLRIGNYILQIMRLRLVIKPEVQIAMNVHTQTKIEYVAAKAFWLNDEGVKVRKFTRSLGRLDEYKGIKDPKLIEEANAKIQEVIYKTYKESYPV